MSLYGGESESSGSSLLVYLAVFFALGGMLAFYVQKRLETTSAKAEMASDGLLAAEHLSQLRQVHAQMVERLRVATEKALLQEEDSETTRLRYDSLENRIREIRTQRRSLETEINQLANDFTKYKEQYRLKTWNDAVNEQWPEIKTLAGKTYYQVTIRKVTAKGIEFTHATGISRLAPSSLARSWHERFQW